MHFMQTSVKPEVCNLETGLDLMLGFKRGWKNPKAKKCPNPLALDLS